MNRLAIRVNGRGNAWPVPLGEEHPFYSSAGETPDYGNASFSIIEQDSNGAVVKDLLIDAGHGIIPFLLTHGNRIPDALLLTHPHFDHILGVDWIVQSYYRFRGKKRYPVYATRGCREQTLQTLPHLQELIEFRELRYGVPLEIMEAPAMNVTAIPVYHGPHARGAAMLLFRHNKTDVKILFTGDLLFPLLRRIDLEVLVDLSWLVSDANNRFPWPRSNHWSVVRKIPEDKTYLDPWLKNLSVTDIMIPHNNLGYAEFAYLQESIKDFSIAERVLTVKELAELTSSRNILLTHYSGLEDQKYYGEKMLDGPALKKWAGEQFRNRKVDVHVPGTGDILSVD